MNNAVLLVDQYRRYVQATQRGHKINPAQEAQSLSQMTKAFREVQRIAIVEKSDQDGFNAYMKAGFKMVPMNGNRSNEALELISQMADEFKTKPPRHLFVVTDDPMFQFLFKSVPSQETTLSVWVPGSEIPAPFLNPNYDTRLLKELLPETETARVAIFLDYENLEIGLRQRGITFNPKVVIEAIKAEISELGETVKIIAYADWKKLSQGTKFDLQRELELINVETRYQINMNGKNSADMRMADDIRTLVDLPNGVDIIALVTGDRDFRPTVDTAKSRGKKVVVAALKDSLSRELAQAVSQVYYLDQRLNAPAPPAPKNVTWPTDPQAELVLRMILWLNERHYKFGLTTELVKEVAPVDQLHRAVELGTLTRRTMPNTKGEGQVETLALNPRNTLVETASHLIAWAPWRLTCCLNERGWTTVDTGFLVEGMKRDRKLTTLKAGQTWVEAEGWLELLAKVGVIAKGPSRPSSKKEGQMIRTWKLVEQFQPKPATEADQPKEVQKPGQEEGTEVYQVPPALTLIA